MSRQQMSWGPNPEGNTTNFFNPAGLPLEVFVKTTGEAKPKPYRNDVLMEKLSRMTANNDYKPSTNSLAKVAEASKYEKDFHLIIEYLYKRLGDDGKHWKRIYKALLILEYLLNKGNEMTIVEASSPTRRAEVATLSMFQYNGGFDGKDIGQAVRDKAKDIVEFIDRFSVAARATSQKHTFDKGSDSEQDSSHHVVDVGVDSGGYQASEYQESQAISAAPPKSMEVSNQGQPQQYSLYGTYKARGVNPFASSDGHSDPFSSSSSDAFK